jgi:hypothetical protein
MLWCDKSVCCTISHVATGMTLPFARICLTLMESDRVCFSHLLVYGYTGPNCSVWKVMLQGK